MTDFLKIAKSIVVHFAHICAYGVETVKRLYNFYWWAELNFEQELVFFKCMYFKLLPPEAVF